jgi:hypothetical protein
LGRTERKSASQNSAATWIVVEVAAPELLKAFAQLAVSLLAAVEAAWASLNHSTGRVKRAHQEGRA